MLSMAALRTRPGPARAPLQLWGGVKVSARIPSRLAAARRRRLGRLMQAHSSAVVIPSAGIVALVDGILLLVWVRLQRVVLLLLARAVRLAISPSLVLLGGVVRAFRENG